MKAVCTTLGWLAAAAAPTAGAALPLGDVFPMSPLARACSDALPGGQFMVGGPMDEADVGVMSMGSRGGASVEPDEGRMGIDLCMPELCGSGEKGLRRASATDAIIAAWRARAAGGVVLRTRGVFRSGAATPLGPAVSFGAGRRCGGRAARCPSSVLSGADGGRLRVCVLGAAGLTVRRDCGGACECDMCGHGRCGEDGAGGRFYGDDSDSSAAVVARDLVPGLLGCCPAVLWAIGEL
jgi:hypothetical protein